jgi:hypothetical protein
MENTRKKWGNFLVIHDGDKCSLTLGPDCKI